MTTSSARRFALALLLAALTAPASSAFAQSTTSPSIVTGTDPVPPAPGGPQSSTMATILHILHVS